MNPTRRPAEESDRPFVWRACVRAYTDVVVRQFGTWDEDAIAENFAEKWSLGAFEVVELAGERVGAILVTEETDHVWLREVFLLPGHQGNGVGSALVRQELARAREVRKPLRLRVLRENRARRLYERLGLRVCGETDTHFWMEAV